MRAPVSVIIPTLNAEATLSRCLSALLPGLEAGLIRELIVTDGGSEDATCALATDWGAQVVEGPPSRGGQLARGCAAAGGGWLLILHADTVLAPDWVGPVMRHIQESPNAGWFSLAFDSGGPAARAVAGWANLRSRLGLPYGDQGLLLPVSLYDAVGGYRDQPLMEDVAIARALRGRLRPVEHPAITSARRYREQGWLRRGARNLLLLVRYFLGTRPEALARSYSLERSTFRAND